jgi:Ulp1 family protease
MLIPVNWHCNHWILLVVRVDYHISNERILIFDSMREADAQYTPLTNTVCAFLRLFSINAEPTWVTIVDCPQQGDLKSCGLYTCLAARHVVLGMPLLQRSETLDLLATRRAMALELLRGQLAV